MRRAASREEDVHVRVLVIENPRSGSGSAGLDVFLAALDASGADVTVREMPPHADLTRSMADASTFDRIVAAGGDGTASAVAHAAAGTEVPLLVYPAGTANLIASNLGLPADPGELARIALQGHAVATDLGEIRSEPGRRSSDSMGFALMAGAGFDAKIMESATELKSTLGAGAYFVSVLMNMTPTMADIRLELDGDTIETDGIAVIVVNFGKIQFDLSVTHDSDASDGLFEVVVIRTRYVAALIPAAWAALLDRLGEFPDRPGLQVFKARDIRVRSDPPLPLQFDGELAGASTPFSARVLPGAARFIVPRR
jgi:diacylglycerol kinase family enzyme